MQLVRVRSYCFEKLADGGHFPLRLPLAMMPFYSSRNNNCTSILSSPSSLTGINVFAPEIKVVEFKAYLPRITFEWDAISHNAVFPLSQILFFKKVDLIMFVESYFCLMVLTLMSNVFKTLDSTDHLHPSVLLIL